MAHEDSITKNKTRLHKWLEGQKGLRGWVYWNGWARNWSTDVGNDKLGSKTVEAPFGLKSSRFERNVGGGRFGLNIYWWAEKRE